MSTTARTVVLTGIDDSKAAHEVVKAAAREASHPLGELHIVYCMPLPLDAGQSTTQALEHGRELLERVAKDVVGPERVVLHLAAGAPWLEIVQLAANLHADLVVVGTHDYSPLKKLVLGSVAEQVVKTPVPVYVEYTGSGALKRVVLRYKGFGMTEFANVDMVKMGSGYGASAKCTDVQQGDFKYFIQGFDDQNDVIASAGSRKNPFVVNIRASVDDMNGDAPRLPGKKPEKQCGETCPEGPAGKCCRDPESCKGDGGGGGTLEVGAECSESTECKSSMCTDGKCAEAAAKGKSDGESCEADNECSSESCKEGKCAAVGPKKGPRIFIGLGAAFDITFISSTDASTKKACLGGIGAPKGVTPAPDEGYRCAENGAAYPSNSTQFTGLNANGNAGAVQSGTVFGNFRILASFDYAPTGNILIGGRAGIVLNGSPISSLPYLHVEVRFHYVFGQEALWSKHAVSPYIMVGAGVSTYDAAVSVPVREAAGTPLKFVDAWASGGPVFASVGGGIRVQLGSPKAVMMLTPVKAVISIPPNSTLISLEPELAFAFGF